MEREQQGFTLVELLLVIVILAIVAVTAAPRFVDLGSEARTAKILQLEADLRAAAELASLQAMMPGMVLRDPSSGTLWLDMNRNGIIDSGGGIDQDNPRNNIGIDIKLIANSDGVLGPDNFEVAKLVNAGDDIIMEVGERHQAYLGFDRNGDGSVKDDNCRVYYSQPIGTRGAFVGSMTDGC
ncbi:MAG: prepilin-type N-terminal cleavage/methylation domain-containing protein [Idiomarina sp.]|nr:prepilin-type N-terminal cleavage/methylation domain-containing protein [Idiomarina sp.]